MSPSRRLPGQEVLGWLWLGQPSRATALFAAGLNDPHHSRRDQVSRRAGFAAALLEEGDRSQAFAEGTTVLTDVGERGLASTRILNKLRPLRAAADTAGTEEFRERFDAAARALTDQLSGVPRTVCVFTAERSDNRELGVVSGGWPGTDRFVGGLRPGTSPTGSGSR